MKTIVLLVVLLLHGCTSVPAPQQIALFRAAIITTINSFAIAKAIDEPKRVQLITLVNAAGESLEALLAAFNTVNQATMPTPPPVH